MEGFEGLGFSELFRIWGLESCLGFREFLRVWRASAAAKLEGDARFSDPVQVACIFGALSLEERFGWAGGFVGRLR